MPKEIKAPPAKVEVSRSFDGKHVIEFSEGSHRYKLDGKACPGMTTVGKGGYPTSQGLIYWQKEQALKSLFQNVTVPSEDGKSFYPRDGFWPIAEEVRQDLFKEAKNADRVTSQEAADIGTLLHEYCYLIETDKTREAEALCVELRKLSVWDKISNGVEKFNLWKIKNAADILVASESLVASPTHLFCGKFDRLARRGGILVLSDFKTSKSIYLDQFTQLGGYAIAIREWLGLDVGALEVLRFGKEDGEFETLLVDKLEEIALFKEQAIRCRQTYEFKKLENDPRWKYEAK